jgi:hypothetical protein
MTKEKGEVDPDRDQIPETTMREKNTDLEKSLGLSQETETRNVREQDLKVKIEKKRREQKLNQSNSLNKLCVIIYL